MDYVMFGHLPALYISKMAQVIQTSTFILENEGGAAWKRGYLVKKS